MSAFSSLRTKILCMLSALALSLLACATLTPAESGSTGLASQLGAATVEALAATQAAVLTAGPLPSASATTVPVLSGPDFFREEFSQDLSGWEPFIIGTPVDSHFLVQDDSMLFQISDTYLYAYLFYDLMTYTDVELTTHVQNYGASDNYVTLVCRESEAGWYEFNISATALYEIYFYDAQQDEFELLDSGDAAQIHDGKEENDLRVVCQGSQLSLYANGAQLSSVSDKRLEQGRIGFAAGAREELPVTVAFDWLLIRQP